MNLFKYDMDGIYHRIERNGKWESICFSDLTDAEREEICKDKPIEWFKKVVFILAEALYAAGEREMIRRISDIDKDI